MVKVRNVILSNIFKRVHSRAYFGSKTDISFKFLMRCIRILTYSYWLISCFYFSRKSLSQSSLKNQMRRRRKTRRKQREVGSWFANFFVLKSVSIKMFFFVRGRPLNGRSKRLGYKFWKIILLFTLALYHDSLFLFSGSSTTAYADRVQPVTDYSQRHHFIHCSLYAVSFFFIHIVFSNFFLLIFIRKTFAPIITGQNNIYY